MRDTGSVPAGCGYRVTALGIDAMNATDSCRCRPTREGQFIICLFCETTFGVVPRPSGRVPVLRDKRS